LVVQQVFPLAADDVFADEHADGVSGAVAVNIADVVQDRGGDLSVGRVDDFQLDGKFACAPFVGEHLGFLGIRPDPHTAEVALP
jgi:hypothetical protein